MLVLVHKVAMKTVAIVLLLCTRRSILDDIMRVMPLSSPDLLKEIFVLFN